MRLDDVIGIVVAVGLLAYLMRALLGHSTGERASER